MPYKRDHAGGGIRVLFIAQVLATRHLLERARRSRVTFCVQILLGPQTAQYNVR